MMIAEYWKPASGQDHSHRRTGKPINRKGLDDPQWFSFVYLRALCG
jgi:hypothetical protein